METNIRKMKHKSLKEIFTFFNVYSHSHLCLQYILMQKLDTHTQTQSCQNTKISFVCASILPKTLYCISCKIYDGKMHTRGPLMQLKHKIEQRWMSKSFIEMRYVLYYSIQVNDFMVTGMILLTVYMPYASYRLNHISFK